MRNPSFITLLLSLLCIFIDQVLSSEIDGCSISSNPIPPAKNVHDLHPIHIKVIASIGDSITAGVAAKNVDTQYITEGSFIEFRGLSWLSGGDKDATSIANYIKHYSNDLFGSSIGEKPLKLCSDTFFCTDYTHSFDTDQLNAALPSATSYSIKEQVNYLIQYIGKGTKYDSEWKMINIFIGTNDIAVACQPGFDADHYEKNIREGLELLKSSINNVIIQLVPLVHTEEIPGRANELKPGYQKKFEDNTDAQKYECLCCRPQEEKKASTLLRRRGLLYTKPSVTDYLKDQVEKFNQKLISIGKDYGKGGSSSNDQFTVVYQQFPLDIQSLPVEALSNVDGYHPNVNAYRFFSKAIWNEMFIPQDQKYKELKYDDQLKLYCPSETDRIRTD